MGFDNSSTTSRSCKLTQLHSNHVVHSIPALTLHTCRQVVATGIKSKLFLQLHLVPVMRLGSPRMLLIYILSHAHQPIKSKSSQPSKQAAKQHKQAASKKQISLPRTQAVCAVVVMLDAPAARPACAEGRRES